MNRTLARIVLITAGLIWGIGFVVNKLILDFGYTESELLFVRFSTATIVIFSIYWKRIKRTVKSALSEYKQLKPITNKEDKIETPNLYLIKWGLFLGVFLYLGFYFQTWGLANTTPSHNALITAGYIIMMPIIIYVFERTHIHIKTIMAGVVTLAGILLITVDFASLESGINFGDMLTFIGAFFYAIHLYFLGKKSKQVDLFVLMAVQLLLFSVLAFIVMIIKDGLPPVDFNSFESIKFFAIAVLTGFFASFLAFLFQSIGQKNTNEAEAAILISTESLFGPIIAIIFYGDEFSPFVLFGMILVFGGIIISELDLEVLKKKTRS